MQFFVTGISVAITGLIIFLVTSVAAKENAKKTLMYSDDYFVMQTSRIVFSVLLFFGALLNLFILTGAIVIAIKAPAVLIVYIPLFFIILYFFNKLLIGGFMLSLIVDGENLIYRGFWNTTKKYYTFSDISYIKKKITTTNYNTGETLYAYSKDNKKLFAVTNMLSCYDRFVKSIQKRNLPIESFSKTGRHKRT